MANPPAPGSKPVPFDREGTLRKAEKLLRQGKIDLAIAEYRAVVENDPNDWATANTVGDLYFRAGQSDKAVAEYTRIAEQLAGDGALPKAIALYKKILKIKPDDEKSMWQLATACMRQRMYVDARQMYQILLERRRASGDRRGVAEVLVQLGGMEGADLETKLAGARARGDMGQKGPAAAMLKRIADELEEAGQKDQAFGIYREACDLMPHDDDLRRVVRSACIARGDFETARQYAEGADDLKDLAEQLELAGRTEELIGVLAAAAEAEPGDTALKTKLTKAYLARGDMQGARSVLTAEVAGSDPDLQWTLAELELRDGHIDEGTLLLRTLLAEQPGKRDDLVILGCSVGEVNAEAGFQCIEVAATIAIAGDEWGAAAAAVNEFVHRVPNHIPALMRLVEICVDGGLEATMHSAQAQLADAYLEAGAGIEARVIAEDLVAREPWEKANIERFRRALTLLGESDIDGIIAERLSGQSPFMSTDFLFTPPAEEAPAEPSGPLLDEDEVAAEVASREPRFVVVDSEEDQIPTIQMPAPSKAPNAASFMIDVAALLQEAEPDEEPAAAARQEVEEIDLSQVLDEKPASIDTVLKRARDEAAHDATSPEVAEQHFKLATMYVDCGMVDDAIKALEVSARSLRHRFRAGAMLGKLYMDKGDKAHAIEWLERAAEAPAPSPAAGHQLLYELATVLEAQGEKERALAVLLELQSQAGEYRDLATKLQSMMGT